MTSGEFDVQLDGPFAELVDSGLYTYPWQGNGVSNCDTGGVEAAMTTVLLQTGPGALYHK